MEDQTRKAQVRDLRNASRRVLRRLAQGEAAPAEWTPWALSTSVYTQTRGNLIAQGRLSVGAVPSWDTAAEIAAAAAVLEG